MCRADTSEAQSLASSMDSKARAQRMQKRADAAALYAAQAQERCEEKKKKVQHLKLEVNAQQSSALQEICNSPAQVAKRVDAVQLSACSSPTERFAHQLDLIHGTQEVVDKLQKRIDSLQKHCGHCEESSTSQSCNCIHCWEARAQKKREMASTLALAADVARKQCGGYRGHSLGAVPVKAPTSPDAAKKPRSAKHLQALQASADLMEAHRDCANVKAKTAPPCLMRRAISNTSEVIAQADSPAKKPMRRATVEGKVSQAEFPAMKQLTGSRPRSASCVSHATRRRHMSNEDF